MFKRDSLKSFNLNSKVQKETIKSLIEKSEKLLYLKETLYKSLNKKQRSILKTS